ncbi:MAG: hypothetical protein NT029_08120 [Armatimonadetes bacterium]|nr:hypothetical protein [Armatimonadota bacterium]
MHNVKSIDHWDAVDAPCVIDQGSSRPVIMRCARRGSDGPDAEMVVKPVWGRRRLVDVHAELLGTLLARSSGLLVPDPAIVHVPARLAEYVTRSLKRPVDPAAHLGFAYIPGLRTFQPAEHARQVSAHDACILLAFDAMVLNTDRPTTNVNCAFRGRDLLAFDMEWAFVGLRDPTLTRHPWLDVAGQIAHTHALRAAAALHVREMEMHIEPLRTIHVNRGVAAEMGCKALYEDAENHLNIVQNKWAAFVQAIIRGVM